MGQIYLMTNTSLPYLIKVGATSRTAEERLTEHAKILPGSSKIIWSLEHDEPFLVEGVVIRALKSLRANKGNEWFVCSEKIAIQVAEDCVREAENDAVNLILSRSTSNIMVKDAATLGRLVQRERKSQQLTQQQLAAVSGTGVRFIVDLEAGKSTLQFEKVTHILNNLGIRLVALPAE